MTSKVKKLVVVLLNAQKVNSNTLMELVNLVLPHVKLVTKILTLVYLVLMITI
jgi:hypothetical protein